MRRPIKVAIILAGVIGGLAIARFVVWKRAPELMERMMENVMPQMMDTCFRQMSQERREFMLGHCRGLLDQMDERYSVTSPIERSGEAPEGSIAAV
jgi:hypothetical protein